MMNTIFFDMDGTIADLYGVEGWLDMLTTYNTFPYEVAKPLIKLNTLARVLNRLQKNGYRIGVISWLAKNGTEDYNHRVAYAKREWLKRHMPSVNFDEINIIAYGTPKENFLHTNEDILFDDELKNRENWKGRAFDVDNIINVLKTLKD